ALTGVRGLVRGRGADRAPGSVGVDRGPASIIVARAVAGGVGELVDGSTGNLRRTFGARAAGSRAASASSRPGAPWAALRGAAGGGDDGVCSASGENAISTTSQPPAASAACVGSTACAVALTTGACALASATIVDRNPIANPSWSSRAHDRCG